jgi:hypothetical protein
MQKCWHCGAAVSGEGAVWITIAVNGYLDNYDDALCHPCAQQLFQRRAAPTLPTPGTPYNFFPWLR